MPPVKQDVMEETPMNSSPAKMQGDQRMPVKRDSKSQFGGGGNRGPRRGPYPRGGGSGGGHMGGQFGGMGQGMNKDGRYDKFSSMPGPTTNLQPKDGEQQKKFTGRCRLFVGNLTPEISEDDFKEMFSKYGEISEVFLNNQKGFGFVKMDTKQHAEDAKAALDGTQRKGRVLRVRFATHGAALRVRNLSPWVSNELLEKAFSLFGEVERAVVIVDDRGRPVGEGIVEFARRPGAQVALKRCTDGCFLITSAPRPVIVEPLEQKDEEDGLPEKNLPKTSQYLKERDIGARFTPPGTFEYEFANRWKQLYLMEKQKRDALEKEISDDRDRLDEQMDFAVYEQETNILREKLRQREEESNQIMREREMRRREHDRREQEMRRQHEEMLRHRQGGGVMSGSAEDMRRRQEDNLLMQATHLNDLLTQQEVALRQMQGGGNMNNIPGGNIAEGNNNMGGMGGGNGGPAGERGYEGQNMGNEMSGRPGPMPQRQSRFDQQPQGPGGPMNNRMSGGPQSGHMGPGGPMGEMRGGMGRREMMERRDHRDEYGGDAKRRRYYDK